MGIATLHRKNPKQKKNHQEIDAISWLLFLADEKHDLVDIAERSGIAFFDLVHTAQVLEEHGLITACS